MPALTGASVNCTNTGPAGTQASAGVSIIAGVFEFDFVIPEGQACEVTQAQLSNDLVNVQNATMLVVLPQTSNNSNAVSVLNLTVSDPPTQGQVQAIADGCDQ